jgi:hypothetical protein
MVYKKYNMYVTIVLQKIGLETYGCSTLIPDLLSVSEKNEVFFLFPTFFLSFPFKTSGFEWAAKQWVPSEGKAHNPTFVFLNDWKRKKTLI